MQCGLWRDLPPPGRLESVLPEPWAPAAALAGLLPAEPVVPVVAGASEGLALMRPSPHTTEVLPLGLCLSLLA